MVVFGSGGWKIGVKTHFAIHGVSLLSASTCYDFVTATYFLRIYIDFYLKILNAKFSTYFSAVYF